MRATLVVHEHNRFGRGIELATLAEELKPSDVGLEFLAGELQGSHGPSGAVFTVLAALSGMEREYIRARTLEGHKSARKRGKTIAGAGVTDNHMLSMALHLREQEMSLRDIAARLVITTGRKKGQHPSPATVMRMLREHGEQAAPSMEHTHGELQFQVRAAIPSGCTSDGAHQAMPSRSWNPPVAEARRSPGPTGPGLRAVASWLAPRCTRNGTRSPAYVAPTTALCPGTVGSALLPPEEHAAGLRVCGH
ncbi:recombinase family protein [Streptomyces sp. NPDC059340]|uniref:recombinase family protein n=1 Tax=Streptomyces sp. NPDC059340 TaxID=3346806 RepID=UPI00368F972D